MRGLNLLLQKHMLLTSGHTGKETLTLDPYHSATSTAPLAEETPPPPKKNPDYSSPRERRMRSSFLQERGQDNKGRNNKSNNRTVTKGIPVISLIAQCGKARVR